MLAEEVSLCPKPLINQVSYKENRGGGENRGTYPGRCQHTFNSSSNTSGDLNSFVIPMKKFTWPWGNIPFNYKQLVSSITKIPALLECVLIFAAFCSVPSPHMCLMPLASLFSPWHAHVCIVLPLTSSDNRPSTVMCYIHSLRGNDCTDYINMTAAEDISVSTCISCMASSPADSSKHTSLHSSFYF